MNLLNVEDVQSFCKSREVDIVLAPPPPSFVLCLHGQFDGYGDFFSLVARDVEYVDIAAGFTVGDLRSVNEVRELGALSAKWSRLASLYSGPAVAFRSANVPDWGVDGESFVLVANTLEWLAGRDWSGKARLSIG